MKALKAIKKFFIGVLTVVFFTFVIVMTMLLLNYNEYGVTQFGDTTLVIIDGELASDNYKKGDLLLVEKKKIDKINHGDEVFTYLVNDETGQATITVGTVSEVYLEEEAIAYESGNPYSMKYVIGEKTKVYHDIGLVLSIIESKWGFLFLILVPCFLIFIYNVYILIVEIKYGDELEEQTK